jgi:outer membrane protein
MRRLLLGLSICLVAASPARAAAEVGGRTLTLDEALRTARANHPQIQAARAQTEASGAKVSQLRAPLLPQISASGSYSYGAGRAAPGSAGAGSFYRLGLGANQLVYDFGQSWGKWDAAKATLQSALAQERNAVVQLAFNLRSAYFAAAAAKALVRVAEENLRNQDAHLRQIQGFVEAGTRPEIDLAQARTDCANARVQLINVQVVYDTDKALLNQAMGVERGTDWDVADEPAPAVAGEDGDSEALLGEALKARPDLAALGRQIEAQELIAKSIRGAYAPTLTANAALSELGPGIDNLAWGASAGLSLNWQLFGGGITGAQMREARANTAALKAQHELQRQQVRADVEQARLSVRATKAAIEAAHEATANARVRLTLAEGRYQAGVGNVIELGDSQLALSTAAAQEVQAVFNLSTARARLLQALGQP